MLHAFVGIADKIMCSRCGNEVLRIDEICPAITDGQLYQGKPLSDDEIKIIDDALRASTAHLYDLKA